MDVTDLLNYVALAIDALGIILLIYGVIVAVVKMVRAELSRKNLFGDYEDAKLWFIQKIIISLDLFVASGLVRLVLATGINDILTVALTVAIRTVLSWSLTREIESAKKSGK